MTGVHINRREALGVSALALGAAFTPISAQAQSASTNPDAKVVNGHVIYPVAGSNPLECKITAFTTVSPDVKASITFYRDVIGMTLADEGTLADGLSTAPGVGRKGRRYAILNMPPGSDGKVRSAEVRVLEAPRNAAPNRPRAGSGTVSGPQDPGLLVMEGGARDPAESYAKLAAAGTPMISPPRYYWFRNTTWGRDVDVMSYAPFGPGGEQLFLTANIRGDRPAWTSAGVHSGFSNAAITSLDQRPCDAFFEKTLGLKRTSQMECYQKNANQLIGAPDDGYFLWGNVGSGVSIEVWEFKAERGTTYPTALDRTGLAMLTIRVNDLAKCRAMCQAAGVAMVGEGALPQVGKPSQAGFTIRGAVGELIEVVGA
jgi:catechol 2,3-dioxygenase-like lactoylglutathione lyase family enzyme